MAKNTPQKYRVEKDSLGEKKIPLDAYYGIQTARALENFSFDGRKVHPELIYSLLLVKKACCLANQKANLLPSRKSKAILQAIEEALKGRFYGQFPLGGLEGGALTSLNMNANEVIANRALELLGKKKGEYQELHPADDVNMSQSTNDVVPTALSLTSIQFTRGLIDEFKKLEKSFEEKAVEFKDILKLGRTHLQDAVPITLGEEFKADADIIKSKIKNLEGLIETLSVIHLGGTAIGTKINAPAAYIKFAISELSKIAGEKFTLAENLIAATQDKTNFCFASSVLRLLCLALSKIASDLILLSSGPKGGIGEIILPAVQPGSSIMPGKVNPVIPELIQQIHFIVAGNDLTICLAVERGQLELNVMLPTIADKLLESYKLLTRGVKIFNEKCIKGIKADSKRCRENLEKSTAFAAKLAPVIGYEKTAEIVKQSLKTGRTVKDIAIKDFKVSPKLF